MKILDSLENLKTVLLASIVFALEFIILFFYITYAINIYFFLLLHFTIVFGIIFYIYLCYRTKEDLKYPLLLFIAVFGAGPIGVGGFLFFSFLKAIYSYFASPVSEWFKGLFPEQKETPFEEVFQRIKFGWDDYSTLNEVSSFQNIFSFGTLSQKQAVLDTIVKDFNSSYAPILKMALDNNDNTLRIQAAAIVSKIALDYEKGLDKKIKEKEENPDDLEKLLDLANAYDDFVNLDILTGDREKMAAETAVKFYRESLQKKPEDRSIWFSIGRLLFRAKQYEEFLTWLKEYREKFKDFSQILHTWELEALYKLKRFDEFTKIHKKRM